MKDDINNDLNNFLSIKSKTWTRDSHGLFDYESTTIRENILLLQKETVLIRKRHDVKEMDNKKPGDPIEELVDQYICNVEIIGSKSIKIMINYM
jgi:hypothetical protein